MNYAKALRIVRAHRGLTIPEAAAKWCLAVNGRASPSQVDLFATMLETLETGLDPLDPQLAGLAKAYGVNTTLFASLAIATPEHYNQNSAEQIYRFIAEPAP